MLHIADYKKCTTLDGKGLRNSIYVSGCRLNCEGCFNKAAQDFKYGRPYTEEFLDRVVSDLKNPQIKGLSILGGEPFDKRNVETVLHIVAQLPVNKDLWIWSGYTFDELYKDQQTRALLYYTNVLVDGPFIQELFDPQLAFRGSSNQRIIDVQKSIDFKEIILLPM